MPELVKNGFIKLNSNFANGNQKIREHYEVARICLEAHLHEPLVTLLLMIVTTCGSASETPGVHKDAELNEQKIVVVAKKEPSQFAAALATRMLWFLKPDEFPWNEDSENMLAIKSMTTKIGK